MWFLLQSPPYPPLSEEFMVEFWAMSPSFTFCYDTQVCQAGSLSPSVRLPRLFQLWFAPRLARFNCQFCQFGGVSNNLKALVFFMSNFLVMSTSWAIFVLEFAASRRLEHRPFYGGFNLYASGQDLLPFFLSIIEYALFRFGGGSMLRMLDRTTPN